MVMVQKITASVRKYTNFRYNADSHLKFIGIFLPIIFLICHQSISPVFSQTIEKPLTMTSKFNLTTQSPEVSCTLVSNQDEQISVKYQLKNTTDSIIYIFDSARMPYILLQEDGSLLILHGVHPHDPLTSYNGIEIPITKAVKPGDTVSHTISLTPLILKNHYQMDITPTEKHGNVTVHCQAGWGKTPILASESHTKSITTLLEWQNIAKADPVQVNLP